MKRVIIVCLALFGNSPLFAGGVTIGSPVGVYLEFEKPPSDTAINAARNEASDIFRSVGITIAWRLMSENHGDEAFSQLALVTLTGKCACEGFMEPTFETMVLGETNVLNGEVQPFIKIRCDAIRQVLTSIEFSPNRRLDDAVLGRAIGRVLAHELYHVVLETTHHAASGLAKKFLTAEELESPAYSFDKADWDLYSAK